MTWVLPPSCNQRQPQWKAPRMTIDHTGQGIRNFAAMAKAAQSPAGRQYWARLVQRLLAGGALPTPVPPSPARKSTKPRTRKPAAR